MKTLPLLLLYIVSDLQITFGQANKNETAIVLENKADTLFKYFKYDSAAAYYCKAAEWYGQKQDWLPCVKNYRLTSNTLIKAAKYDTAYYFSQKAMDLANKHFQESNKEEMFEKADAFINMADVSEKKGKFKEELLYCKNALELTLKTDSLARLRIAAIWNKTGVAFKNLGEPDSAVRLCTKALNVRVELLGGAHVIVAESNFSIGRIYADKGKYEKALEYYQKTLNLCILILGKLCPEVAACYNNIGLIYRKKGDYDKAIDYYLKALKINIAIAGEHHPDVTSGLLNIGTAYFYKGDYEKALEYYQKTLVIYIATLGEQHPDVARSYNNIGGIFSAKGDYNKALEYWQKALKIRVAALGEQHPDVVSIYNNMGIAYNEKGDYNRALEYWQKALNIRITKWGEQHPDIAGTYINMGIVYDTKGDYDKALEYTLKALNINIKALGECHQNIAESYTNLGIVYWHKRDLHKAMDYHQKALGISIKTLNEHHPDIASGYNNIGEINSKMGRTLIALQFYQKALMSNIVEFTDTSIYTNPRLTKTLSVPILLSTLTSKANAFYQLYKNTNSTYDIEQSLSTYTLAFQLINSMRNAYNIEATKLLLSEKTKKHYAQAANVAMEYARINPSKANNEKAFQFIEQGKSATLSGRFNEFDAKHFAGIPDTLLELEKDIKINIGFYGTQIAKESSKKNGYDTLKVNAFENEKFTCSRRLDSLISWFETAYPAYYELKYTNKTAGITEIQKNLGQNSAILNYFVGDSSLFVATITDSLYKMEEIPVDSSFKKLVIAYYRDIKMAEPGSFASNSQRIYEKLLRPVNGYIVGKAHLVIIPDDYLYYVPFETLIDNTTSPNIANSDYSKLNYLIKSHSISYHHSATLWYNSVKKESQMAANQKMNFIGFAPVFSIEKNNGIILSSNISAIDTTDNLAYRHVSSDLKRFNPLPYSKDELTSVVHLFEKKKKEAKAFIYSEANEANFKNNAFAYDIIHIASHGFSNDKEPGLSGIVFSQPTDTSAKEDGILYTGETYNLNLNADLIVLSACESGLGKLVKGEGLQALSRGFLYAGIPNVIFSLWRALDKPTKDLMEQFYASLLEGNTYAESLRLAKLKLINDPKTAFPHFWGEFALVGK